MSTRVFQSVINQLKDTVDRTIAVMDDTGVIIACSELVRIGEKQSGVLDLFTADDEVVTGGGNTYRLMGSIAKVDNVIMVQGDDRESADICAVLAVSFANIKNLYGEKYDKSSFIKNIILDNILPSDIYIKAKELHFNAESSRAVFFVRFTEKGEVIPYDIMQNMFPDKNKDYVISIGENDVVLVSEVKTGIDQKELEKIAHSIVDTISAEFFHSVTIGIGSVSENIKDLAVAFRESQVAIEVGKVFDTKKSVISYENLGIGRLIYQLPTTL